MTIIEALKTLLDAISYIGGLLGFLVFIVLLLKAWQVANSEDE